MRSINTQSPTIAICDPFFRVCYLCYGLTVNSNHVHSARIFSRWFILQDGDYGDDDLSNGGRFELPFPFNTANHGGPNDRPHVIPQELSPQVRIFFFPEPLFEY